MIPLLQLSGCSKQPAEKPTAPAVERPAAPSRPATPAAEPPKAATPQPGTAGVKVEESDPTAQALGYRHDAAEVDTTRFPRFAAGQSCASCRLFDATAGAPSGWGACSLFAGKLVSAGGWCNGYVPVA